MNKKGIVFAAIGIIAFVVFITDMPNRWHNHLIGFLIKQGKGNQRGLIINTQTGHLMMRDHVTEKCPCITRVQLRMFGNINIVIKLVNG